VTFIPITADRGLLALNLTGKIDTTDFSAATTETLAQSLANSTRLGVLYTEVDESAVTALAPTKTVPFNGVVPGGSLVTGCIISCRTAFTGDGTVTIGTTAAEILANANITKTLHAISGEDPALYGTDLWVPGSQTTTAGDYSVTAWQTLTAAGDWTVTSFVPTYTQTKTPTAISATGTQTKTATNWTVGTYGHPKMKWCANDTQYNAYCHTAGSPGTAGILDCYLFYQRAVDNP
jgi:hypothetical protein